MMRAGLFHGEGELRCIDDDWETIKKYSGTFAESLRHGLGVESDASGTYKASCARLSIPHCQILTSGG